MNYSQATKPASSIKPGTIWQLGDHRLAYGDCRDKELLARLVGKEKIKSPVLRHTIRLRRRGKQARFLQALKRQSNCKRPIADRRRISRLQSRVAGGGQDIPREEEFGVYI